MATELDMGMRCIKYMLLTVNLMFLITAALIVSVGTTIYAIYYDFDHFIRDGFYSPASLLIAIGIIMLVVSLFGCVGAAKESTAMINVFALLLSLVFILDIAAAIAAYSLQNGLMEMVDERLRYAMDNYHDVGEAAEAMDFVQSRLTCCGIESPEDWASNSSLTRSPELLNATEHITLPNSCCIFYVEQNSDVVCNTSLPYYTNGCRRRLIYVISQSAFLLGTGALTIAFIQFIGVVFALMLAKSIRQAKTDRERRKWEIREQIINSTYTQMEPHQGKKNDNPAPVIYVPHIGHSVS